MRAIAQYSLVGQNYSVPTIEYKPKISAIPESFSELRELIDTDKNKTKKNKTRSALNETVPANSSSAI